MIEFKTGDGPWHPVTKRNGEPLTCETEEYAKSLCRFCLAGTTHIKTRIVKQFEVMNEKK